MSLVMIGLGQNLGIEGILIDLAGLMKKVKIKAVYSDANYLGAADNIRLLRYLGAAFDFPLGFSNFFTAAISSACQ